MKLWCLLVPAIFAISVQARDDYATTYHSTIGKQAQTYYSYSYKPGAGTSVRVKGFGSGTGTGMHTLRSVGSSAGSGSALFQRAKTTAGNLASKYTSNGALQSAATKLIK